MLNCNMELETNTKYIEGKLLQSINFKNQTFNKTLPKESFQKTEVQQHVSSNLISTLLTSGMILKNKTTSKGYKRRPGLLYKKVMKSKLYNIQSHYFISSDRKGHKWIPPRSPYALLQEDLFDRPWQLLIATIFLNKTKAKKAVPYILKFLIKWPLPKNILNVTYEEILEFLQPLGLGPTRSRAIMKFTVEYLTKNWKYPRELYGIGKYGDDSFRIFCINEWREVTPDDIPLSKYKTWLLENEEKLGLI
uniref:HhH-GPD domain-containing protein n=1 Tax=Clastoptera arizonana TaxID=38151 RepID=A0A1B6E861_9HEMI